MTIEQTRNEAAERLLVECYNATLPVAEVEAAALLERIEKAGWTLQPEGAESRATVERIRPAIDEVAALLRLHIPARGAPDDVGFSSEWEALDDLAAILDEEAAR